MAEELQLSHYTSLLDSEKFSVCLSALEISPGGEDPKATLDSSQDVTSDHTLELPQSQA